MKTQVNTLISIRKAVLLMTTAFLLVASPSFAQSDDDGIDWELQREEVEESLHHLQDDVDDSMDELKDGLGMNEPKAQEALEEIETEFEKLGHDIDVALERSQNATEDTWSDVNEDLSNTIDKLEMKAKQLEEDMKS